MAFVNSTVATGSVAPWGGAERRLPQSYRLRHAERRRLAGHGRHHDVRIPEGKIRVTRYAGKQLPDGVIIDSEGNPTTDPAAFYGSARGALLPLGGSSATKGTR